MKAPAPSLGAARGPACRARASRAWSAALLGVAAALFSSSAVRANGTLETYGPDPRMRAMGNAGDSVDDVAAAHTNPAALGRAHGALAFEAAFSLDTPVLDVELDKGQPADKGLAPAVSAPVAGYQLAFTIPIDLVFEDRLFVGAVGYFPTNVLVRARAYDPQRPFFYTYDSYTDHYDLSIGAGARITDWLFAGVGLRLAAGQGGNIDLAVDPVRGRLTEQSADTFQFPTASLTAGLLVGPLGVDDFLVSAGLVYRDKTSFDVSLPAALAIDGAGIDAVLDVVVLANFEPRTVSPGLSFEIVKDLTLSFDAQYAFWSEAPPPLVVTTVKISGDGVDALGLGGALDAPAAGQDRVPASSGFVDTINWRAGLEYRLFKGVLALRAGYQYRPTPVPDQTSGTNIIDNNTHVVTAGFATTFKMPHVFARPVTLDLAYQAQILEPRTATKTNPRDAIGNWTSSGVVHALAVGWTYRF